MADPSTPLRLGVIGVGHLGKHHARIAAGVAGARLTAVADTQRDRAVAAAAAAGAKVFEDYRDLFGQVDAVTVAAPTEKHHEIALAFLERGVSVLVEKPITRALPEADALIAAAKQSGATLATGHTERYNPAVAAVLPLVSTPRFIEVHRLGVFPDRSLDIDVVFDLMIHDLDIILALVKSEVSAIEAVGVPVLTDKFDIANARLRFASGCIANVTASRISRERVRKIRFFQPDAYISIDYAEQSVEGYRLKRRDGQRPEIQGGQLPVAREEPLKREIEDFVGAVRDKRAPLVSGEDGRRALALAQAIADKMETV
ncbi:MAG TPA: Gfo/Idh/MocA family oxidoreductase [Vicinamibacterales bacterium]|nr:Gfo/Idh/MocA family oxidoreductase [Vicinamibacterales bacterium]